jgi:hypothetical protein
LIAKSSTYANFKRVGVFVSAPNSQLCKGGCKTIL